MREKKMCEHDWELKDLVANIKTLERQFWYQCKNCDETKTEPIPKDSPYNAIIDSVGDGHPWGGFR